MKRAFASLDDYEALHVAIFIEERNARIYENFAEMFREFNDAESRQTAATFQDMADEERCHGFRLQQQYVRQFGNRPCSLTDADIADVIEVPQLQNGEMFISGGLTRTQVFQVALTAERQARHYYTELAGLTLDAPLRGLYQELANFEQDHVEFLVRKLSQVGVAAEGA